MNVVNAAAFTADRAWGSLELLAFGDHRAKVHWTDQPYRWHENTGDELFLVIDGVVDMYYVEDGEERVATLRPGDAAVFRSGDRHVAHPRGAARVLVVERHDTD
ncbi:MAG TPA: cupin domain-containing protein [Lysobacter sp.]|nr:cupin domain-containing protein [Lysobacter sp.]